MTITRRIIMQKARRHPKRAPTACKRTGSGTFSLLCSRCFSPFLHSTCSLSVSKEYLALRDGPRRFTQNSSCSALLRIPPATQFLHVRDCHPLRYDFPDVFHFKHSSHLCGPTTPHVHRYTYGLGCSAFARHYSRNHFCFLFLRVLRCFSSPR